MLCSVEQALVGRNEKRAPPKTPAWDRLSLPRAQLYPRHLRVIQGQVKTVMQTRDEVQGLYNCGEFSQPLKCSYQAMQTQEKTFLLVIAFIK